MLDRCTSWWGKNRTALLLLFACSLAVIVPLFRHGPSCGHDFDFHLLSWVEAAHDWRQGLLDPQWIASANYGAGEPRFVFYPPASWVLGGLLGGVGSLLFEPQRAWTLAPLLFTFGCVYAAGVCVFLLVKEHASRQAATVAACLFVANPYLLFVAYERTAYGELLATPLMAMLLLCALRRHLAVAPLALIVATLWFTNAPAAVMGCYTLALVCGLRLLAERCWLNAGKAATSTLLGLALAGCYLVPAVWQQRWVQIGRAVGPGMRIDDSFLFHHTGEVYHDVVLHAASVIVVMMFSVAAFSLLTVSLRSNGRWEQRAKIFAAILAVMLFLQFPVSRFLWHAVPHMTFLQFPWRWMLVASIVTAALIAYAISRFEVAGVRAKTCMYLAVLLIAGGSIWSCSRRFVQYCDEEDRVSGQLELFDSGAGVEGTDEYAAMGADNSAIFRDLPEVRLLTSADAEEPKDDAGDNPEWDAKLHDAPEAVNGVVQIAAWQPEEKQIDMALQKPAFAVLKLMDYPAWGVSLNGHAVVDRLRRGDGLMVVAVPSGSSHILVRWKTTPDVILGRELSATAVVMLVMIVIMQRRRRLRAGPLLTN